MNVDTNKLRKCGYDIIKLNQDLHELYTAMYDRIYNMPTVTGEWLGDSAIKYSKSILKEKSQAIDFGNQLYLFGSHMIECANNYDDTVRKTAM